MNLQVLNRICFAICMISIVAGSVLALSMIWNEYSSEFLWKSWLSVGVLFLASALTLAVSSRYGGRTGEGITGGTRAMR